jgi:hypothetical protein
MSISLSLTGEPSGVPHRFNSLNKGEQYTHHMGTFTPHRGTHRFISNDTLISWASSPHRGTQRSFSVSERNDTPISWEHPTHGLSHRPTHPVCVLEDVSCSCNHQHFLSTREAFSTRPSLSRKYSNFVLASGLVKISAICSCVGRYCTCTAFLCTMSMI